MFTIHKIHNYTDVDEGRIAYLDLKNEEGKIIEHVPMGYQFRNHIAREEGCGSYDTAYCLTAHKSQGTEAEKVMVISSNIGWLGEDEASWKYTAVTRAQEKVAVAQIIGM